MDKKRERIIKQIAIQHGVTPQEIKHEMMLAITEGQNSPDPFVRAQWKSIPRKGSTLTLEEFLNYLYLVLLSIHILSFLLFHLV